MPRYKKNVETVPPEVYEEAVRIIRQAQLGFGYTVRRKRQALGLTQREMALLCRIEPGRLCEYERARRFPSSKSKGKIINGFMAAGLSDEGLNELRHAYRDDRLRVSAKSYSTARDPIIKG